MAYTPADKKLIKKLKDAGTELTGEETSEELQTLSDGLDVDTAKNADVTEKEVLPGVPNDLPVRTEKLTVNGKVVTRPIHFVAAVKGGFAAYGLQGQRISAVEASQNELARKIDRTNSLSRAGKHPGEMAQG